MMLTYESICDEMGRLFIKETVVLYTQKSLEQILSKTLSLLLPNHLLPEQTAIPIFNTKEEEQYFWTLVELFKCLFEVIIRDHIDLNTTNTTTTAPVQEKSSRSSTNTPVQVALPIATATNTPLGGTSTTTGGTTASTFHTRVPIQFQERILQVLYQNWNELELQATQERPQLPHLSDLQWRVNVLLTSNSINKKTYQPTITLQIKTTSGHVRQMEVSMSQFHQLRYTTAKILQEMQQIQQHPIMRLTYETKQKTMKQTSISS